MDCLDDDHKNTARIGDFITDVYGSQGDAQLELSTVGFTSTSERL